MTCYACGVCGYPSSKTHHLPDGDFTGSAAYCIQALGGGEVVVGMSRAAMKGTRRQANATCKGVQLNKTVSGQVEPGTTESRDFGIVDVYQFSPPRKNVTRRLTRLAVLGAACFGWPLAYALTARRH